MKKAIPCFLLILFSQITWAQVIDGIAPGDSTIIKFTKSSMSNYIPDTALVPLWQIGQAHKVFFGDSMVPRMMTDTVNPYRINSNNWFVLKVKRGFNTIIDFWHKFETDSNRDGGLVEFSMDHGATWENVKGPNNSDSSWTGPGVLTSNFYTFNDTLPTGEPLFTGTRNTTQYSRFQFFYGFPIGPIGSSQSHLGFADTFYIRFRFISDSVQDSLAGWIIDSIKIENDDYGSRVVSVANNKPLHVFPNPSDEGSFNFPSLYNEQNYTVEIYNTLGTKIITAPYSQHLDLSPWPKGLYFYRVTDHANCYTGRLQTE